MGWKLLKMSSPHRRKKDGKINPVQLVPISTAGTAKGQHDSKSKSISRITHLKEESITNYSQFYARIQSLTDKVSHQDTREQLILLFTATEIPGTDQGWCNDCNYLEAILTNFMRRASHLAGYLVRVKVGSLQEWTDISNPYRTDPKIHLKSIPTLVSLEEIKILKNGKSS